MKNRTRYLIIIILIFTSLLLVRLYFESVDNREIEIRIGGEIVTSKIADTPEKRTNGLSNTKSLDQDSGLLFVFENEGIQGFWMKDMNYPIDIIWIGRDKRISGIERNISPDTYPEVFTSPQPIKYVLEVNAGFSDKFDISLGERVDFDLD